MKTVTRFRELRKRAGLTQPELVKQFNELYGRNYTEAAISQFENDKRMPSIEALKDFADFYGVSIDYLIGLTVGHKPTAIRREKPLTIGERLRELRLERDLTQEEFGKIINKSAQSISNWERGYTPTVDIGDIQNIAKALGISISCVGHNEGLDIYILNFAKPSQSFWDNLSKTE